MQSSHSAAVLPDAFPTDIPSNTYKPAEPWVAEVLENTRLTAPDSPNDVRHLVFNLKGGQLRYLNGQSVGILPPGLDGTGKPHKLRLYSIASPAEGDEGNYETVSLCVKRAITVDPETGKEYHGVCSSYLCNLIPGQTVNMTGPVGKAFLMPNTPDANLIMIATGTGIAPFRAFLKTRYGTRKTEKGQSWLFFGCQTQKDLLYPDELAEYGAHEGFHCIQAISREQQRPDGGRMYVQHRLIEHSQAIIRLLQDSKTYLYICGLKGMESGILEGLEQAAQAENISWPALLEQLKAEKRWHVEVY